MKPPRDITSENLAADVAALLFAEMFRLKAGETHGDLGPRSASRLAILPDTTHVTLMQRIPVIVPMVNDFLSAKP